MKCIRNIMLQSLTVLIVSPSAFASSVEPSLVEEQSFIEVKKQKLIKKIIAMIDNCFSSDAVALVPFLLYLPLCKKPAILKYR